MSHTRLLWQLLSDYGWIGSQIDSQGQSLSLRVIGMSSPALGRTMRSKVIRTGISSPQLSLITDLALDGVAKWNWPEFEFWRELLQTRYAGTIERLEICSMIQKERSVYPHDIFRLRLSQLRGYSPVLATTIVSIVQNHVVILFKKSNVKLSKTFYHIKCVYASHI